MSGGGTPPEGSAGYRYYFGIHAGIGRGPMDELVEIRIGGKLAAQPHMTASGSGSIDQPELFGGDKKEGGISGYFRLLMGESTQTMPDDLAAMIAPAVRTGFRRMATFFYNGLVAALNPYPKPWSFRMRRAKLGWDGAVFQPDLAVITLLGPEVPTGAEYGAEVAGIYRDTFDTNTGGLRIVDPGGVAELDTGWSTLLPEPLCMAFTENANAVNHETRVYSHVSGEAPNGLCWFYNGPLTYVPFVYRTPPTSWVRTVTPPAGGTFIRFTGASYITSDGTTGTCAFSATDNEISIPFDQAPDGSNITIEYLYNPNIPDGLTPDRVIKAMNPAHIIFECLTNREWGRGMDRSIINVTSFESAAQALYDEGFGMCLRWARRDSINSFIKEILDTCGAALYMDRTDALMSLKLIRKDYVYDDVPLWDTTNGIMSITNSNVNTSAAVINEVIVQYRDPVFNEDRSVNVQNLASLQSTGGVFRTITKQYKGIPTGDLARRVAQRDLRANSEGLRRFDIVMDRRGAGIVPGFVMRIRDEARQIEDIMVRVAQVKEGTLANGQIQLLVIQDVFSFPNTTFVADQPSTWQRPNFAPCIGEHEVFEVPYFLLARTMGAPDFALLDNESAYMGAVAEQAKSSNVGYDIAVRNSEPELEDWPADGEGLYCGFDGPFPDDI